MNNGTYTAGSSTVTIGGNGTYTAGTFTSGTGTVRYNGAAQNIANVNYNNIELLGTGTKTFPAAMTIGGSLSITNLDVGGGATLDLGSFTHSAKTLHLIDQHGDPLSGTYGSTGSVASVTDDKYFTSTSNGVIYVNVSCIPGTWTGLGGDNRWDNTDNWSCSVTAPAVPDATTDVTIPALSGLTPNYPLINVPATVKSLTLQAGDSLKMSGTNTLTVSGNWTNNGGTYKDLTGTVIFNGVSKTIGGTSGTTFYNVSTAVGASPTASVTTGAATTINGTLTIGNATTFNAAGFALTVAGTTTVGGGASGILNITSSTGAKTFNSDLSVAAGGTFNNSGNSPLTLAGSLAVNATGIFTSGTGVYTLSGSTKTISGTISIPSVTLSGSYTNSGSLTNATLLTVTSPGVLTNNGTITATTALSGTGGLTQGTTGILNLGGTSGITTLTATAVGNTVNYSGTSQTLKVTGYSNLTLSGGAKTFGAITTVGGNLTLSGTATATMAAALSVGENLTIGTGTTFNTGATNSWTLGVTGTTSVTGTLTLANTGTKTFTGDVSLNAGSTWNETGAASINFAASLLNNATTFTANTGTHTFSGAAKTIGGTATNTITTATFSGTYTNSGTINAGTANINGAFINNGTVTATTALTGSAGFTQGASSTLNINFTGTPAMTGLDAATNANTVNYGFAGIQTLISTSYSNLTLSTSGIKTFPANTTIGGNLSITGASANLGTSPAAHTSNTLYLGGAGQIAGTWGSTTSAATNKNNTWFSGTGVLTVATFSCTPGTWYGTTSTDWGVATNWCNNTLPDASTNVIIPTGVTNYPVISSSAVCNDLTIGTGGSVTIFGANTLTVSGNLNNNSGGTLTPGTGTISLNGNWTNSGTFTPATSTVILNGAAQTVSGTTTFNNLTVANSGTKTLSTVPTINGTLSMEGTAIVSAVPTYGTNAILQYNTATGRTAGVEWPASITSTLTGGVIIKSTGTITMNEAKTFGNNSNVPLNINSAATLATNNLALTFHGNFVNAGTLTAGSSAVTITGTLATQDIDGFITTGALSFNKTGGTANIKSNMSVGSITFSTNTGTQTLSLFNSGVTLNVTGTITIPRTTTSGMNTMAVGAGTLNAGSIAFTSGSGTIRHQLTISTGSVVVSGDITTDNPGASAQITFTDAGTLKTGVGLLSTTNSGGTLNLATGCTVEYNGNVNQTVHAFSYNNLTLSGSGTKTLTGLTTVNTNLTMAGSAIATTPSGLSNIGGNVSLSGSSQLTTGASGTLTVGGGTGVTLAGTSTMTTGSALSITNGLTIGDGTTFSATSNSNLTVSGNTTVGDGASGTLAISATSGTKAFNGNITVSTGATWNNSGNLALTLPGSLSNSGTFTAGSGVHTFSGASKTLAGTLTIPSVTISGNNTNSAVLTSATALIVSGTLTNSATVTANGTASITGTLNNNGTVTAASSLSGAGSLIQGASSILNLNFAAAPTISAIDAHTNANAVNYALAGDQSVYNTVYHDLAFSTSGVKTLTAPTTISNDLQINATATAELGSFTHLSHSLHFDTTLESDGTYGSANTTALATNKLANFGTLTNSGILYVNTCVPGTWVGGTSSSWKDPTNWSCGIRPTSLMDLTIPVVSAPNVYPAIDSIAVSKNLTIMAGASLTITGSNSLTVNGNWNNSGTFTANGGALTVTGSATNTSTSTFNANTGTLTVTGDINNNASSTFNANTGTVTTAGNLNNLGTFAQGTGSIVLNGVTQSISGGYTYNNVTLGGTGAKTFGTGAVIISGILSVENGANATNVTTSLSYGAGAKLQYNIGGASRTVTTAIWPASFTATGGVNIQSGTITLDAAKTFGLNAPLTIQNGATLTTGNFGLTFGGDFVNLNSSALSAGSSPIVISNTLATQNIGSFTTTGLVSMTKTSGTATFTGNITGADLTLNSSTGILNLGTALTHTFSGTWTRTNGTLDGGSSTLKLSASPTPISGSGGTFTMNTGTVEYSGGSQLVAAFAYYNLTLSGSGTKTFAGTVTVANNLTIGTGVVVDPGVVDHSATNLILETPPAITTGVYGGSNCSVPGAIVDAHFANGTSSTGGLYIGTCLPGKWLGLSADWSAGTNWCGGSAPTNSTDVIIPSGTPNNPVIGSTAECRNININVGATLSITGTNTLSVKGDWTNSGTFTPNSSTVILNGTTQTLSGGTTFSGLTIQSSAGLTFGTGSTAIGGILSIETGSPFTFTGSVTYLSTATLQYNAGTASRTAGAEWPGTFATATGGVIIKGTNPGTITMNANKTIGSSTNIPLNINAGGTLATGILNNSLFFNGDFINAGTLTAGSSNITIQGTYATQNIGGFTTTGTVSMTKTSGTATFTNTVNGNALTINGSGGTLNLGAALVHTFTGNWTMTAGTLNAASDTLIIGGNGSYTAGTFTPGTSKVSYNAAGAQNIMPVTYNNMTLSGSGTKTYTAATTINGILSIEGTATTTGTVPTYGLAATLQYKGSAAQVTATSFPATWTGSGGVIINNPNGVTLNEAKIINGPLTITGSSILNTNGTSNWSVSLGGNFTNNGTFTANGSNITISGTGTQSIAGFTTTGIVSMTKTGGTATLAGPVNGAAFTINGSGGTLDLGSYTHTFTGIWTRTAGTLLGNASTLNIGGTTVNTAGTFTAGNGLVNYNSAFGQTIATVAFNNLTLSGAGIKTIQGATINGILSLEGTATTTGSLTGGTGGYGPGATLKYKGSSAQTTSLSEFPATFNGSGGVVIDNAAGVTLNANKAIGSNLTLTNGVLATGAFTVSPATVSRTSGWVNGALILPVAVGSPTVNFLVGDATNYIPVSVAFTTVSVAGTLSAKSTGSAHPQIATSNFDAAKNVTRYWTFATGGSLAFAKARATLGWVAGDVIGGASYSKFTIGKYSASTWSYPGFNNRAATTIDAMNLTALNGDYITGEVPDPTTGSAAITTSGTFTVPKGVYSLDVISYGGGGAGGGATDGAVSGGGGGGAVQKTTIAVTPGQVYTTTIGAGGTGVTGANGGDGGNTIFTGTGGTVTANGGKGAPFATGASVYGIGGAGGTGTFNGGNGGTADNTASGSGAGGAGDAGNGGNGSPSAAGTGGAGSIPANAGGTGGAQILIAASAAGNTGVAPGAGGSGALTLNPSESFAGGNGGNGQILVAWTCSNVDVGTFAVTSPTLSTCANSTVTVPMNSTVLGAGTYNLVYELTGANTSTHTVTLTMLGDGSGTFVTDPIPTAGATTLTVSQINCTALVSDITAAITVNPLPTITTTGTATAACYNAGAQTTSLSYSATANSPTSYSIAWSSAAHTAGLSDQGSTSFAFSAGGGTLTGIDITAGTVAGTYSGTMTLTNGNVCTSTLAVSITVHPVFTTGAIATTGETTCYNGNPGIIGSNTDASGGDNTITYKWESSTDAFVSAGTLIVSATGATYDPPTGLTATTSYRRYAHDGTCSTSFGVSSGTWLVTVHANFTPGAINTTGETICYNGDPSSIGSTTDASGGDETITYQWESSTDAFVSAGTPIVGATGATYDPPTSLTATTSYRRYAHDGTCNTSFTVSTGTWLVTVNPVFTPGAVETTGETICYNGDPGTIGSATDASGGNGSITYKWVSSTDGFSTPGILIDNATSATYDPPSGLTVETSYRRYAHDGSCNTAFEVSTGTWQVTVRPNFTSGVISATGESICNNGDPSSIGSTTDASGGDNTITYQWESSTDGFATAGNVIALAASASYDPPSGLTATTSYRRYAHDGTCNSTFEVSTGTWVVTVNATFATGSIQSTGETVCYNGDPGIIGSSADASGGDNTITYKWESSTDGFATAGSPIALATAATYNPPTGLTVATSYRRYAHDGTCSTSFDVSTGTWLVAINPAFTSGAIETTGETICYNGDPGTIGSTTPGSGGDGIITYKWESSTDGFATSGSLIALATAATFDPPTGLTATTSYRRYAHDGTCNTSFEVSTGTWQVTVKAQTSISADPTSYPVTAGGSSTDLSVTAAGSGTLHYQWYSNTSASNTGGSIIGTDVSTYTPNVSTAGTFYYYVAVTGDCGTATSSVATVTVNSASKLLDLKVYLEGPFSGGAMLTTLRTAGLIPLAQPFSAAPWSLIDGESASSIPAGAVDWVLVELRDAATPAAATVALSGWPKAYFVKSDGSIVDKSGNMPDIGTPSISNNLYVIVRQRNHIAIMSSTGVPLVGNNYTYDFSTSVTQAFGGSAGYKSIGSGKFGMVSGDADSDGSISVLDFSSWATDFGKTSIYLKSDIDCDGEVSVLDFSKWATNFGLENIAPLKGLSIQGVDPKATGRYKSQVPGE